MFTTSFLILAGHQGLKSNASWQSLNILSYSATWRIVPVIYGLQKSLSTVSVFVFSVIVLNLMADPFIWVTTLFTPCQLTHRLCPCVVCSKESSAIQRKITIPKKTWTKQFHVSTISCDVIGLQSYKMKAVAVPDVDLWVWWSWWATGPGTNDLFHRFIQPYVEVVFWAWTVEPRKDML